jgi:hypothetical protein
MDGGATTRVLVQPCDLHPTNVVRCDCLYDVTFTIRARADRTAIDVYKRFDFYGETTPPMPTLAATASLGAALQTFCSARGPLTVAEAVDAGDLIACPANGSCVPFAGGGQAELPDGAPGSLAIGMGVCDRDRLRQPWRRRWRAVHGLTETGVDRHELGYLSTLSFFARRDERTKTQDA